MIEDVKTPNSSKQGCRSKRTLIAHVRPFYLMNVPCKGLQPDRVDLIPSNHIRKHFCPFASASSKRRAGAGDIISTVHQVFTIRATPMRAHSETSHREANTFGRSVDLWYQDEIFLSALNNL